jgi:DNA mismatch repair ATPase MutS
VPESVAPCFKAAELGHPLIPAKACVQNDISIDSERRLIMVSGSNMSGKSTLLRAIGVNLVLAGCGAPVKAKSLKTSCFIIGTAMRANDSLKQGSSLFYAAISKIKRVVELAGQYPPLLFLLDEILQGTNSHDRLVGAKGIIYHLIGCNAVGLVTTHDLALTKIVDSLGSQALNIHFKDYVVNGQINFDYKIRSGVIQKSNGLELMRMIGLDMNYEAIEKT